MRELIFQCQVCSARLLRAKTIEELETCPRCGQQGQWQELRPVARSQSVWLRDLFERIEGSAGPVVWQ